MSILTEQTFTNKEETRAIIDEVIQMAYESVEILRYNFYDKCLFLRIT